MSKYILDETRELSMLKYNFSNRQSSLIGEINKYAIIYGNIYGHPQVFPTDATNSRYRARIAKEYKDKLGEYRKAIGILNNFYDLNINPRITIRDSFLISVHNTNPAMPLGRKK